MFLEAIDPLAKALGEWSYETTGIYSIILRIVLATLLGGLIGFERSYRRHPAGFRTYILVCLGSAMCMMVNGILSETSDGVRLAAGIITGVGFLGAGVIYVTTRSQVRGITTAASMWVTCATGIAVGSSCYSIALISFVVVMLTLTIMPYIEHLIDNRTKEVDLHVELQSRPDLKTLITLLREKGLVIKGINYDSAYADTGLSVYSLSIHCGKTGLRMEDLVNIIKEEPYVSFVEAIW
ncbi:MAG: MgtC/SapB family protein [Acholeplasmatales bacterium]|nr:MgtC/SapB family protein [Acholeplasmatales bacterium]